MKFKILGTNVYISFLFTAVITVMLATDRTGMILPTLFAVMIHELGHLLAMWALDCAPKQVKLIPASIQITSEFSKRYRNDIIIALCGPLVNLVIFLALYTNHLVFKNEITLCYALLNLIVFCFNILPVSGLDGGTILFSTLAKKGDYNKAKIAVNIITLSVAVAGLILAVTLTIRGKINISLYIIVIYLIITVFMKR